MSEIGKLLINESPLTVLPSLVKLVGLERAIILQQVHYACQQPKSGIVLDDGEKYVWNTYQDWKEDYFPFWEADTIRKHFAKLESENLIISCQPNKKDWDRTKHYRINYEKLNARIEAEDNAASEAEDNAGSNKEAKTSSKKERELRPIENKVHRTKNGLRAIAANPASDKQIENYLEPIRDFYGGSLADEFRWGNVCALAIENHFKPEELISALSGLMTQNRDYPITPENVYQMALEGRAKAKIIKSVSTGLTPEQQKMNEALTRTRELYYATR